jgi:dipeptidyl aminopeptidase/acylaminoacyl peptidase
MRRLMLIALLSVTLPALGQIKHSFTFEEMETLKRVGKPEASPDGKWVIFNVLDVDLNANTNTPHIWIVPATGGTERILIKDQDGDRPRWSPDGKRFAFVSNKDGGSQVWVADFDDAAGAVTGVSKLTSIATEAGGELWAPDGKNILFVSNVYPGCSDEGCNALKLKQTATSTVKAMTYTRLLFRHMFVYSDGRRSHIFVTPVDACFGAPPSGCTTRDLTPGDFDSPVVSFYGQDNYAFSPDGREICYASNHDKNEANSTNNDLWIVPVGGGAAKDITADNPASDLIPLYSPDGRYIAYIGQQRPGYESDLSRLILYDRRTKEKKPLTDKFDRWVGTFLWAPDSRTVYFAAEDKGEQPIYRVAVDAPNAVSKIISLSGYEDDPALASDGRMFFTHASMIAPEEIYRTEVSEDDTKLRSTATQLTHFNDAVLAQISLSPLESFWFTGAHGDQVEGFLVKPPDFDPNKKYPVKLFLKGGPQIAWGQLWAYSSNLELFAAGGYVVITVNFHGSTGYGQKFIDAVNGDWGGAPYEDQMKALDYAEKTYPFIDKDRECAIGGSYGGYMSNWVLGHTDRFKCIVSHHSVFNLEAFWGSTDELWFPDWDFKGTAYDSPNYEKWSPHRFAKNFKTPTLVSHGQLDYKVDVSQAFQLFTTLQMEGVPSKLLYFPDEAQYPRKPKNAQLWYKTINDWVDQWTKK